MDRRRPGEDFVTLAHEILADGRFEEIAEDDLRRVLTAAVRLYAAKAEAEDDRPSPVDETAITPTDVVVFVSALLRAVDINLFDLAMWYRRPEAPSGNNTEEQP